MVFEISSALLHFLVGELKVLEGGKIEKIYQLGKDTFIFRFYNNSQKFNLRISVPGVVCLSSQEFDAPKVPPGFCMFLRKYLTNSRLVNVEQKDFERILVFKFQSKSDTFVLIIELFKPANIVLCKEYEGALTIINSFERQRFKDRVIKARSLYEFPPSLLNPLSISKDDLIKITSESDRSVVKTLASKLGLGGVYAEELLHRASIDKNKDALDVKDAEKLVSEIKSFFSSKSSPHLSDGNVYPVRMLTKKADGVNSISEGVDSLLPLEKKEVASKKSQEKKDKTSSLVEIQEKMIKNLELDALKNQEIGEFIYSNYQDFKQLIDWANDIRNKNGLDVLEKELKKNPKFKSLDKKAKDISLKF